MYLVVTGSAQEQRLASACCHYKDPVCHLLALIPFFQVFQLVDVMSFKFLSLFAAYFAAVRQ